MRSALVDQSNTLVIVLGEDNGLVHQKRIIAPTILPVITSAETNYLAFGIASPDYHIELYGYLQSKENKHTVKSCDDYIFSHYLYDSVKHYKPSSNGKTHYQTLPTYIRNAIDHPSPTKNYTQEELNCSIKLLMELCK